MGISGIVTELLGRKVFGGGGVWERRRFTSMIPERQESMWVPIYHCIPQKDNPFLLMPKIKEGSTNRKHFKQSLGQKKNNVLS